VQAVRKTKSPKIGALRRALLMKSLFISTNPDLFGFYSSFLDSQRAD
jgi:hypothetical protein